MAVKCLPPLLHVVAPLHVATCVEHIARMLTQGERAETRDLAAIALKTIFMDLSPTHADMVGIMAHLARTLAAQLAESSQHVQLDVLDILRDVLLRFGPSFGPRTRPQHHRSAREGVDADLPDAGGDVEALESTLQPSLYALLSDARAAVRKRACLALAALAHLMPPAAFQAFVTLLVSELMAARPATESTRARVATLLQMVAALVRAPATRARLSPWIAQMVPTITALAAGTVKTGGAADNDDDVAVFKKETDHNRRGHDGDDGEDDEDDEDDAQKTDELREAALQCLHALVSAYPHTMAAFTPSILTTAFACLRYDPNYALSDTDDAELNETGDGDAVMHDAQDDRSEAESADDEDDEDDDMMDDDEDDDVDDDDQSWKVRRAAAKLLTVLIEHPSSTLPPSPPAAAGTSPSSPANHMSSADWRRLLAVLMARITEREESVRLDVLTTLSQWIRAVTAMQADLRTAKQEPATDDASMPYRHLLVRTPRLVAALVKQIQLRRGFTFQHARRNVATRQQTFRLLRQLLVATASDPTAFGPAQMTLVLIPISQSLAVLNNARGAAFARSDQTSSVLKIGVLAFIASLIAARPSLAAESADTLAPLVLQAAKDGFYRLAAQAFDVLAQLVRLMAAQAAPPARTVGLIRDCFAYAIRKIQSTDVDLDVKQTAIQCIASICANAVPVPGPAAVLSGHADADLSGTIAAGAAADPGAGRLTRGDYETVAVPTLLQKLAEDDLTRLSALQAVTTIAESPLWHDAPDAPVSLTAQLAPLMQVLCPLLRKNSHPLRLEVLRAVSVLLTSYAAHMGPLVPSLTQELKRYLADPDMVLMPAVLETLATLCRSPTLFPQAEEAFLRDIAPALVQVIFDRTALLGTPQARPPLRHMVEALAAYPASTAFLLDQMLWPIVDVTVPDSALLARAAQAFPIAAELNAILLSHIKSNSAPLTRIYHAFLAHVDGDGPSREPAASATVPAETSVPESAAAVSDASRATRDGRRPRGAAEGQEPRRGGGARRGGRDPRQAGARGPDDADGHDSVGPTQHPRSAAAPHARRAARGRVASAPAGPGVPRGIPAAAVAGPLGAGVRDRRPRSGPPRCPRGPDRIDGPDGEARNPRRGHEPRAH
ncbi:ARM repeat-containing protein [Caulochytrium protostelioides]|uniref:ARM repeat-containing protein n=1 Tax=Caulochytrium protostelioides TaxID=1555241 RepID=A0A4P9WU02_9FUNG|nr:ARM repeat-containing protein [Caulochytrium protostelioides]